MKRTIDEFKKEFYKRFPNSDIKIISFIENTNALIVENKYGLCKIQKNSLLIGVLPDNISAINKTEYFINKAKEVHGDKYDYSLVQYNKEKIKIICKKHGVFEQRKTNHLNGQNCIKCSRENYKKYEYTTEYFINKAKKLHNEKYDYSKVNYIHNNKKVTIICKIHGEFEITPSQHLRKNSKIGTCTICKKELFKKYNNDKINLFIEKANIVHNNKYNYSLSIYERNDKKIKIICPLHGQFEQVPSNHLRGQGCKHCQLQFNNFYKQNWINRGKNKIGIFYIINCYNDFENFYKFGITFNSIKSRYKRIPYNYKIIKEVKSEDLSYIWDLEKRFKNIKLSKKYKPLIDFDGSKTECFK